MVLKQCPKCNKQVPVACKSCPCGHSYAKGVLARGRSTASSSSSSDVLIDDSCASTVKRRRTERILRARVLANDRLNSAAADRPQVRRRSRRVTSSGFGTARAAIAGVSAPKRQRRGRRKSRNVQLPEGPSDRRRVGHSQLQPRNIEMQPDEVEPEEPEELDVSPEASRRYSIILDEINRKIGINYSPFD